MPLLVTTLGAFPKPSYVDVPDWFSVAPTAATRAMNARQSQTAALDSIDRGVAEVVRIQAEAGVDIPTDGEVARENYVHYHCRRLQGFDFATLTRRTLRDGSWEAEVPTVVGPIGASAPFIGPTRIVFEDIWLQSSGRGGRDYTENVVSVGVEARL